MSILDTQKENFHKMVKITGSGALGGDEPKWIESELFITIATKQSSKQSIIAQKEYAIGNYLITTLSDIILNKGDYIQRDSDKLILKITEPNNNSSAPDMSEIKITSQAYAEESTLL